MCGTPPTVREEIREGRSSREAAALAVEYAGPSVAAAALILAGTFASLMISGVPFFVEIGFAVTLGIVLVALVVSILLVPAVTALVGRAAWWPGTRPGTATTAGAVGTRRAHAHRALLTPKPARVGGGPPADGEPRCRSTGKPTRPSRTSSHP
jgi:uncharacterized membrane protein YdfJ with MMPL/SSD domain